MVSRGMVLSACEQGSRWEQALKLLAHARESGTLPDLLASSAAAGACESEGLWKQALGVLAELRSSGLLPGVVACSAAARACERHARCNEGRALIAELRGGAWDVLMGHRVTAFHSCKDGGGFGNGGHVIMPGDASYVAGASSLPVLAADLLRWYDCSDGIFEASMRRCIYGPIYPRLHRLCRVSPIVVGDSLHPALARSSLDEPVLAKTFGVGSFLTCRALHGLLDGCGAEAWIAHARFGSFSKLHGTHVVVRNSKSDPVAKDLVAWTASTLHCANKSPCESSMRVVGYDGQSAQRLGKFLRPVFVEHDRSLHAERQALAFLLDVI